MSSALSRGRTLKPKAVEDARKWREANRKNKFGQFEMDVLDRLAEAVDRVNKRLRRR